MGQGRHVGKNVVRVPAPLDRAGTVLITGAPGVLGGLVARHLAVTRRAGRLILASRRGPAAAGAARLAAALAGDGAHVELTACDVADRVALAGLLAAIPASRPLTGVIHAAGVLDDGVIDALTPDRLDYVLRPKAEAAIALDELTAGAELSAFVLFSSAAATFGSPGQGNYAAANAFLDALAARRRARGLPAVSIAWGMWEQATGLTAHLGETGRSRARGVLMPLATGQGLDLFDAALAAGAPMAVAAGVDLAGLRAQAGSGMLPPLWHGLVRIPASSPAAAPDGGPLRLQLAGLPPAGQHRVLLDIIREQAAAVLGHSSLDPVQPGTAFRDLGFDQPTPQLLATWLHSQVVDEDQPAPALATSVLAELDRLEATLSTAHVENAASDQVVVRLEAILSKWKASRKGEDGTDAVDRKLESATDDEVFDFLGEEFGIS
jgi:NADP-dependent 3-hydroxy acid dehydrogenase YdfG